MYIAIQGIATSAQLAAGLACWITSTEPGMRRPIKGSLESDCCVVNSCKVMLLAACRHKGKRSSAISCCASGGGGS